MSKWTHAICAECWCDKNPDREATRLVHTVVERCCFCGRETPHGIYVRHSPDDPALFCKGAHDDD